MRGAGELKVRHTQQAAVLPPPRQPACQRRERVVMPEAEEEEAGMVAAQKAEMFKKRRRECHTMPLPPHAQKTTNGRKGELQVFAACLKQACNKRWQCRRGCCYVGSM